MTVRFLDQDELFKTKELAAACFGSSEDLDEYYDNDIQYNRIAVLEDNGAILSMAHLHRLLAVYEENTVPVWYILYVCTAADCRRRGYMDRVMRFVLHSLKKEGEAFTFLVPVNREVYRHLGFTDAWSFREDERDMLYADDGLEECLACRLNAETFSAPVKLQPAAGGTPFCRQEESSRLQIPR